jgi:hypothetical protein
LPENATKKTKTKKTKLIKISKKLLAKKTIKIKNRLAITFIKCK